MTRLSMPPLPQGEPEEALRRMAAYLRYLAQTLNELIDEIEATGGNTT